MSGISGVDIEAWREDEKATEFNRRNADNHAGWNVEMLTADGWKEVGGPFTNRDAAVLALISWRKFWPGYEFRVYERVAPKVKK